jgi:hypothetical protein
LGGNGIPDAITDSAIAPPRTAVESFLAVLLSDGKDDCGTAEPIAGTSPLDDSKDSEASGTVPTDVYALCASGIDGTGFSVPTAIVELGFGIADAAALSDDFLVLLSFRGLGV